MTAQAQRRAETRARLVRAARSVFVAEGFENAATDAILVRAQVSKGALYHHFDSKHALFAAVFEEISAEAIAKARHGVRGGVAPAARFAMTCFQWLKAVETGDARAILIDQGPRVLGFSGARDIEDANSLPLMRAGAASLGAPASRATDTAIRVLNAALGELALQRARDGTPPDAEAKRLIKSLIGALFAQQA